MWSGGRRVEGVGVGFGVEREEVLGGGWWEGLGMDERKAEEVGGGWNGILEGFGEATVWGGVEGWLGTWGGVGGEGRLGRRGRGKPPCFRDHCLENPLSMILNK